jgi:hypothetical protein
VHPAEPPRWSDRDCPLVTAGDRCLWHVGGTAGENGDDAPGSNGSQPSPRVRPVLGDQVHRWQEPRGLAAYLATRPQPLQSSLVVQSQAHPSVPEQELRRLPIPARTGLSRQLADALVNKSVSIC